MDDLIKRSDVIEEIHKLIGGDLGIEEVELLDKIIESIPTAYNVDKVVEEIRRNSFNSGYKPPITKISTNKAIELIKAGGVNE